MSSYFEQSHYRQMHEGALAQVRHESPHLREVFHRAIDGEEDLVRMLVGDHAERGEHLDCLLHEFQIEVLVERLEEVVQSTGAEQVHLEKNLSSRSISGVSFLKRCVDCNRFASATGGAS